MASDRKLITQLVTNSRSNILVEKHLPRRPNQHAEIVQPANDWDEIRNQIQWRNDVEHCKDSDDHALPFRLRLERLVGGGNADGDGVILFLIRSRINYPIPG